MDNDNKSKVVSVNIVDVDALETTFVSKIVYSESKCNTGKWEKQKNDPIFKSLMENSLGIGTINNMYIETNDIQDKSHEYIKICKFLSKYCKHYAETNGLEESTLSIEFLNYGKTELVYVLKQNKSPILTLLAKQPAVEFGKVKQEAENLIELKKKDDKVIAPVEYFSYGDQELYVTPYIKQARCVASDGFWGMYVPEPYYRFVCFSKEQADIVNKCMIAKLVSYYDFKNNEALAACKLGGGDFMLPKGWENAPLDEETTLNSLYFIAAREKIKCTFQEYLDILRSEFSRITITEDQNKLKVNHRGRVPMLKEQIEEGIKLGLEMIERRKQSKPVM